MVHLQKDHSNLASGDGSHAVTGGNGQNMALDDIQNSKASFERHLSSLLGAVNQIQQHSLDLETEFQRISGILRLERSSSTIADPLPRPPDAGPAHPAEMSNGTADGEVTVTGSQDKVAGAYLPHSPRGVLQGLKGETDHDTPVPVTEVEMMGPAVAERDEDEWEDAEEEDKPDTGRLTRLASRFPRRSNNSLRSEDRLNQFGEQGKTSNESLFLIVSLDILPAFVILANSLALGFSLDFPEYSLVWQILELCFFTFYVFEFCLKLYLYGVRKFCCGKDFAWNLFDCACLALMMIDLGFAFYLTRVPDGQTVDLQFMGIMKMFRLARLARLIRTLRFKLFANLKLMIIGVISGLRVIFWAIVLLLVVVYASGITMAILDVGQPEFETVQSSMFTMFRCFTDGCSSYDGRPLAERLRQSIGWPVIFFYIFIIMIVSVGIFNLIMAVFIDSVRNSQHSRKQVEISESNLATEIKLKMIVAKLLELGDRHRDFEAIQASLDHRKKKTDLKRLSRELDQVLTGSHQSHQISRDTFHRWLADRELLTILEDASIEASGKLALFDVLDADEGGELSLKELIVGLMRLRGPVTKDDVIGIDLRVKKIVTMVEALVIELSSNKDAILAGDFVYSNHDAGLVKRISVMRGVDHE